MSTKCLLLLAVAAIVGCASGSGGAGSSPAQSVPRRADLLTAQEVSLAHADAMNAYDAIARLRPNWLGLSTMVFVDGQQHGSIDALRRIPASHAKEFRYYDVTQAGATFGIQGGMGGVVEVRTK